MYKITIFSLFALLFSACSQTPQTPIKHTVKKGCDYYSLKTAKCIDKVSIVKELQPYKVIMIGDHHPEDDLHKNIAKLITDLSKDGCKVILANEWFYPSDRELLKKFESKKIDENEFVKELKWSKRFKRHKYESFAPMYRAIRDNDGELYGVNMSKKFRKKISDQNLSAMSEDELKFNNSLDLDVAPHRDLVLPFLSHCHAPKKDETLKECIQRMYRVQVAWDSIMAQESYKLSKELKENEKLIVFAGSMHIENKLGIPLRFARKSSLHVATIIPSTQTSINNGLGDFIIYYEKIEEEKK